MRSLDELFVTVANAAAAAPAGSVIVSNSDWHEAQLKEQRLPTAAELDRVAPDKPVVLVRGGHSYILNGAALRKWNITEATPVPAGGAISRDAAGKLTGEMFDNAKALVALPAEKPLSIDDLMTTQRTLNAFGITAVRIPGAYKGDLLTAYHLMEQAHAAGKLTLRYIVYLPGFSLNSPQEADALIKKWGVKQDHIVGLIEFANGCLGTIVQSFAVIDGGYDGGHPILINGTDGVLYVPDPNTFDGTVRVRRPGDREPTDVPPLFVTGYGRSVGLADMAVAIRTGRPHRCDGRQAFAVLDLMQGFLDSSATGVAHRPTTPYVRPAAMPAHLPFGQLDD